MNPVGPLPFAYEVPATVDEAIALLLRHGDGAKLLAGGQSLVPMMNLRVVRPEVIVDINRLELERVQHEDGHLLLGALTRHCVLETDRSIVETCPLLSEAAARIGNVRVRTLGTLGGSLAHADPAAELPMAALALDAELSLQGPEGTRWVAAGVFFRGIFETVLGRDQILTSVRVPVRRPREGWAVEEFVRRAGDYAIVAVAVRLRLDGEERVELARISLAGVGPTPLRAGAAEHCLVGRRPDPEVLRSAAEQVSDAIAPESDLHASAAYRRHLAVVLTRRALARAAPLAWEVMP